MKVVLVNDYKGRKKKKYSYDLYEVNRDNLELSKNYAENVQILQMNLQLEMEDYSENNFNYLGSANDSLPCGDFIGDFAYYYLDKKDGKVKELPKELYMVWEDESKEDSFQALEDIEEDTRTKKNKGFKFTSTKYYLVDIELEEQDILYVDYEYPATVYEFVDENARKKYMESKVVPADCKVHKTKVDPGLKCDTILYNIKHDDWSRIYPSDAIVDELKVDTPYKLVLYPSLDCYVYDFSSTAIDDMFREYKYEPWDKDTLESFFNQADTYYRYLGHNFFDLDGMKDFDDVVVLNTFLLQGVINDKEVYHILEIIRTGFEGVSKLKEEIEELNGKEAYEKIKVLLQNIERLNGLINKLYGQLNVLHNDNVSNDGEKALKKVTDK